MSGRQARRALSALLALVAGVLLVPAGLAAPASAADDPLPVRVEITSVAPAVLQPGQDLVVQATLHNDGTAPLQHVAAALRINAFRMGTRGDVAEWVARSANDLAGKVEATTTVDDPLAPGASVGVTLKIPAAGMPFYDLPGVWGPRGLAVEATDSGSRVGLQRSYVLWYPDESVPPVPVSVLLPFTGPAADPTSTAPDATLEGQTAPTGALGQTLQSAQVDDDIGLAVDPALVERARAGGQQAQAWATQMTAQADRHDTFTLPWGDPDAAALAHADHTDLLQVATDTARASDAVGSGRRTILWSASTQALDEPTAAAAAETDAAAVVTRTPKVGAPSSSTHTGLSTASGHVDRLVPDGTLSEMLVDPSAVEPGSTGATTIQRALWELAVVAREDVEPHPVLLAPARGQTPDPAAVRTLMGAFRSAPWVKVDDVSTLLVGAAGEAAALPADQSDDTEIAARDVDQLWTAREHAVHFSTVTPDPKALLAGVDDETLAPVSLAWRADPAGRDALVGSVVKDVTDRTVGLSIAPLSDLNVVGATATMFVVVRNDLSVPATTKVVVTPRKACLQVDPTDPVTVDAGATASVSVPLRAVANCDVRVSTHLESSDGAVVSAPRDFDARVAPRIESIGTYVVGGLLVVGLILGIARTVRRGQSARRGARTEAETGPAAALPVLGGAPDEDAAP